MPNSNTQMIQKGKISSIEGEPDRNGDKTTARVLPSTADSLVTRPLTIPWYLRGDMGNLSPGVEVAYAMFEDGTGLILSRMDGEWPGIVPGDITIKKGALTVQDKGVSVPSADVTASGISLTSHTHTAPHEGRRPSIMSVMASWNGKTWGVSPERIAALNGVSASVELDTENSDDKAGSPATKTKALKLQSMSFDFDLGVAVGCDVRGEYESWTALVGQYAPFYLGGTRFGPANLQLTGVSLGDTTVDNFGRILKGKITINLTEFAEEASSKKATAGSSNGGSSSPAGVSTGVGPRLSAITVGASSSDKAAKKPNNTQLT